MHSSVARSPRFESLTKAQRAVPSFFTRITNRTSPERYGRRSAPLVKQLVSLTLACSKARLTFSSLIAPISLSTLGPPEGRSSSEGAALAFTSGGGGGGVPPQPA